MRTRRSVCLRRHRCMWPVTRPIRAAAHNGRPCGRVDVRCVVAGAPVVSPRSSSCHAVPLVKDQYVAVIPARTATTNITE